MNKSSKLRYTCINCGNNIKELYKTYSPTVLKLNTCENCDNICDKYIEYDPIITIIDLILLKKEAYRHFLYNTDFKNHWKLTVLVQLMEAYSEWTLNYPKYNYSNNDNINNEINFNQKDLQFYLIFVKITISTFIYNVLLYVLTLCVSKVFNKQSISFKMIMKTYTISSFGKFFLLPALIWTNHTDEHLNILFVFIYTTLCQFLVYSVVSQLSMFWSVIIIVVSNFVKIISTDNFNSIFVLNNFK